MFLGFNFHIPFSFFIFFFNLHNRKKEKMHQLNHLLYIYNYGLFNCPKHFNSSQKKFYKKCKLVRQKLRLKRLVIISHSDICHSHGRGWLKIIPIAI